MQFRPAVGVSLQALPDCLRAWLNQAEWGFQHRATRHGQHVVSLQSASNITSNFCLQVVVPVVPAPAPAPKPVVAAVVAAVTTAGAVFWYLEMRSRFQWITGPCSLHTWCTPEPSVAQPAVFTLWLACSAGGSSVAASAAGSAASAAAGEQHVELSLLCATDLFERLPSGPFIV